MDWSKEASGSAASFRGGPASAFASASASASADGSAGRPGGGEALGAEQPPDLPDLIELVDLRTVRSLYKNAVAVGIPNTMGRTGIGLAADETLANIGEVARSMRDVDRAIVRILARKSGGTAGVG